jgi:hypothetical protein
MGEKTTIALWRVNFGGKLPPSVVSRRTLLGYTICMGIFGNGVAIFGEKIIVNLG